MKKNKEISHRGTEAQRKDFKGSIILFTLTFFLLFYNIFAQETQQVVRLSADEAVERAVKNNLSLESSRNNLASRKRASDLSWNQFIPEVMVGGSFILNNEREDINGTAFLNPLNRTPITSPAMGDTVLIAPFSQEGPRWNFAIPIQVSLTLSMAMFENMKRLKLDYQSGLIAYDKAKLQLERDVRKSYNNILLMQENIALLRENYEAMGRRVQTAEANFRAGRAPELTWLQTQVAMENMKPVIDQAENGLRLMMAQFAMFLGLEYDTQFELIPLEGVSANRPIGEYVPFEINKLLTQAASDKPDIRELRQNILILQSVRKTQSNANLPFLNLNWDFTNIYVGDPLKDWRRSGALSITLGWRLHSILPFSQGSQSVKAIDDQITAANIGLAQMIQGTEIEIYNMVLSLDKIRITAEAQARTIDLAERTYRLTLQAFQSGVQDLLQVQNAELELRQARVQMLEQQFNYLNGLLDLEYAIGVPFGSLTSK